MGGEEKEEKEEEDALILELVALILMCVEEMGRFGLSWEILKRGKRKGG